VPVREGVITCEEVLELKIPLPDVVSMQTRQPNLEGSGAIHLRRLVKEALRMRPDPILVGEVRQETVHRPNARTASRPIGPGTGAS
jgi:pilus assembly protein CpaF